MPSHSKVVAPVVEFAEKCSPDLFLTALNIFPPPFGFGVLTILVGSVFDKFQVQVSLLLALVGFEILIWSAKIEMCTSWS